MGSQWKQVCPLLRVIDNIPVWGSPVDEVSGILQHNACTTG
jgi:hypothetical protein